MSTENRKESDVLTGSADAYSGKCVLISGGRGYLGSALAQSFADVDCRVILLDRSVNTDWMPSGRRAEFSVIQGDVSARETWASVLPGVDYLFHLAALEYDRTSYDMERDLQVNAVAVLNCLEVCRANDLRPKIIFSSSANIFGQVDALPVNESSQDNPPSVWSVHKQMAESYLRYYRQAHGIESIVLRLANVYGPTARHEIIKRVIINKMIAKALVGEVLILYSNRRKNIRDFVYINDVTLAFLLAGTTGSALADGTSYVIGSEEGKTFADVSQLIADNVKSLTNIDVAVEYDDLTVLDLIDKRDFVADTGLFHKLTGWKPQVSIEKGIQLTIDAMQSNHA
jgi:UDP-glucose 4-epimerase